MTDEEAAAAVEKARAHGAPVKYSALTDRFEPVTQEDWDRVEAFIAQYGRMTMAMRDFHAELEQIRLGAFPGAIPRPLQGD